MQSLGFPHPLLLFFCSRYQGLDFISILFYDQVCVYLRFVLKFCLKNNLSVFFTHDDGAELESVAQPNRWDVSCWNSLVSASRLCASALQPAHPFVFVPGTKQNIHDSHQQYSIMAERRCTLFLRRPTNPRRGHHPLLATLPLTPTTKPTISAAYSARRFTENAVNDVMVTSSQTQHRHSLERLKVHFFRLLANVFRRCFFSDTAA